MVPAVELFQAATAAQLSASEVKSS